MKIAFFTEMGFEGKVPRTHENMRTEFAWMCALDADHYNLHQIPSQKYDLGIIIIPKKNPSVDISRYKQSCFKVAVMQEGPHWYFQDYDLVKQIEYYNTLTEADIIYTHNIKDKTYYQGLTNHPDVRVLSSLMIEDSIGDLKEEERKGVIIGGNFVSWYGGFDSYIVAQEFKEEIYSPSMGRKQDGEEQLLNQLPYMNWKEWIHSLNKFKYGVHLMRTHAAGTFALNCAYLGIPCIGYKGLDTQELCHPNLSIEVGDIQTAKQLAQTLKNDYNFYNQQSMLAKEGYIKHFNEKEWKKRFMII